MFPKKFSLLLIFSIILTLGLSISLGSLFAAWAPPTATPPGGNIPAPINTGATLQSKQVGLWLNYLPLDGGGSANGLLVQYGNVGIGNIDPQAKLDVTGDVRWSGTLQGGTVPWARLGTFPTACSAGQYVTAVGSTLSCATPSGSGTVTGVTGTAPVASSGGTAPVISMPVATATVDGYMTSVYASKLDGIAAGATAGVTQATADTNYFNVTGDTITGNLTINSSGSDSQINHNTNNPLYINSYDTLQLRINADGVGSGDFGVNNSANSRVLTVDNSGNVTWSGTLQGGTVPWARLGSFPTACTAGQYVTAVGSTLTCATPAGSGGDITGVAVGTGLSGGGTTGDVTLSLGASYQDGSAYDSRFVNVDGDTMTGNLTINSSGPDSQINHNTDNPLYINSYDSLQLRINYNGGAGDFGVNNSANARVFTVAENGNTTIGGTGKLTVTTIDPIFNINGKKYSTYVSDYVGGTRIEVSGVVQLNSEKYTIDFDNLEKGSNLWLFWQASSKDAGSMSALLTPSFEGKTWYKKDGHILTFYGSEDGEVSYRLSAPRVDYKKWGNITEDQTLEGINVSDY